MTTDEYDITQYEELRDHIVERLNPPDDDIAEIAIMLDAVGRAADYIESQPCACDDEEPCGRCFALGRLMDVRVER